MGVYALWTRQAGHTGGQRGGLGFMYSELDLDRVPNIALLALVWVAGDLLVRYSSTIVIGQVGPGSSDWRLGSRPLRTTVALPCQPIPLSHEQQLRLADSYTSWPHDGPAVAHISNILGDAGWRSRLDPRSRRPNSCRVGRLLESQPP